MTDIQIAPESSRARTREGLTEYDLAISEKVQAAIGEAALPKPTMEDMRRWVDAEETRERDALYVASLINGSVPDDRARPLAIARSLIRFLDFCIEHKGDVTTLFRAKQHMRRPRA